MSAEKKQQSSMVEVDRETLADLEGQLAAIHRSQAVIEFDLRGNILTANENFLNTVGYSLEEIQGRHHSMFVEPGYANSEEYREFWQALGGGQFRSGEFHRIGKNGQDIWIQASYNAVKDQDGTPFKVVKYASDITGQKETAQETDLVMEEAASVISAMASGDLTVRMPENHDGAFLVLAQNINSCIGNLSNLTAQLQSACGGMARSASEIAQGNTNLSNRTEQQAASLEQTAASMEQLTSTVQQNADNSKEANMLASGAREEAEKGGDVVSGAIDAMSAINESSKEISDIIGVIEEIAFQTNLLALNAAVEAARAGEQGRGFAVVASEVRNLAQRSSSAAKEITALIKDSVSKVEEGSKLVDASGDSLSQIMASVRQVSGIIEEITAASEEQASGIQQITSAVQQMDQMTQQNAALVEQVAAASNSMQQESNSLLDLVGYFKQDAQVQAASAQPMSSMSEMKALEPLAMPVAPSATVDQTSSWSEF
ncbi:MAG: methyl-accepting chemotaxis protein [Pseudomonadota bacterium]